MTEIPDDRWDVEAYYDPEPGVPGRSVTRWGSFLDDVGGFDSDFFGMTEREATAIDPSTVCCWRLLGRPSNTRAWIRML